MEEAWTVALGVALGLSLFMIIFSLIKIPLDLIEHRRRKLELTQLNDIMQDYMRSKERERVNNTRKRVNKI